MRANQKVTEEDLEKYELWAQIQEEEEKNRERLEAAFIPDIPGAVPFAEQIAFFEDTSHQKLARCGNRAAKTFSGMRDLAWKIMRNHPYRTDYNCAAQGLTYEDTKVQQSKVFWCCGPTIDFVMETMWGMYLKEFIPAWYYTDDDGNPMFQYMQNDRTKIMRITFRNGDKIEFKSYSQTDLAIMGRAIDEAYLDEMPPKLLVISEFVTRTFDRDGFVTLMFTPLVENEAVKEYLDEKVKHGVMALHSWSLTANPHYRDNPERLARALSEWDHLPPGERNARLKGEWYYETKFGKIFDECNFEVVQDFEIPEHWRRVRVVDPAAHMSGCAMFAEDPDTNIWYGYLATQLGNRKTGTDAGSIARQVQELDINEFTLSLYDNAELWFGSEKLVRDMGFQPCIQKNIDAAIMATKGKLNEHKVKLFEAGFSVGIRQIRDYEWGPNGKPKGKHKYHAVDCLLYFCREIPAPPLQKPKPKRVPKSESDVAFMELQSRASRGHEVRPIRLKPKFGSLRKGKKRVVRGRR